MIVVTGKSGSGKTAILKSTGMPNIFCADNFVKQVLYKNEHEVAKQIISWYPEVKGETHIDAKKLGPILFKDKKEMDKINILIAPYVQKALKELPGNSIVEMAAYINNEDIYKDYFHKVILIERENNDLSKFNHIKNMEQPIANNEIKFNKKILNNGHIADAALELKDIILGPF